MANRSKRKPSIPKGIEPSPRQEGSKDLPQFLALLSGATPARVSSKMRVRARTRDGFRAFATI